MRRSLRKFGVNAALFLIVLTAAAALLEAYIQWAYPISSAYEFSPYTDFRLDPNQRFKFDTVEFNTLVTVNEYGLRDISIDLSRPCRVLLLGDSFTFGHGVEDDETFEHLLERRFEAEQPGRFTFINSGHNGYDTRREAAFLEHFGLDFHPNFIVVVFVLNDVLSNSGEHEWAPISTNFITRHIPFEAVAATIEYFISNPRELLFKLGFDVEYVNTNHFRCLKPEDCREGWNATQAELARIKRSADSIEAGLLLVNIPVIEQVVGKRGSEIGANDSASRELERIAGTLGIQFTDFGRAPGIGRALYYSRDRHLNAAGHRSLSEYLFLRFMDLAVCTETVGTPAS
jgi:hypothetical protein